MRFDLTDLRLFLHVIDQGSITRGAERSHLALASASARIRAMEDELRVPLLERERRGIRPTEAGRALAHHARAVLQQVEHLRGDLATFASGLKGQVRLLTNTAALTELLPERLGAFLSAHPHVDVDLEERSSSEIVLAVAEGRAEVGLVADTVDLGRLQTFPLQVDRLVLVTARGHALATRRSARFEDILEEPLIGLEEGSALQEHLGLHAARLGRRLRYRVRLRSFDAVCRMVAHGVGVGVVPESAAMRCQRSLALRKVVLEEPWAVRQLSLCVRQYDALSTNARLLVDSLRGRPPTDRVR
ncbi:LysR family transcriptional regulator [Myxococcaceae bacterium JPH2]|nr:LysR family transcriptional regulator [Myxococcaceae bacterium JPH2]